MTGATARPTPLREDVERLDAASRLVKVGDVRLHVLSYAGEGPPTLVLPGITSPAITWDFVARDLRDSAELHILDLRGRGLSDAPAGGYQLDDYAADALAVIDRLELRSPVLLGHSLGARIAAAAAVAQPDLLSGVILIDPPLSGPGRRAYPTTLASFLDQLSEAQRGTSAAEVRRHYPGWPEAELALRARWLATCHTGAVVETHRGFESDDFFPLWRSLEPPTALIFGADSPVVTNAGARELAAAKPQATMIEISAAGHMVPWDNRTSFVAAVRELLSRFAACSTD